MVLALRSNVTLEMIAEEMQRLNERGPALGPDMIVVADTGLVQYPRATPKTGHLWTRENRPLTGRD